MIEDSPIVADTRKVRRAISERFHNDPDRYIDYLLTQEAEATAKSGLASDRASSQAHPSGETTTATAGGSRSRR